MLKVFLVHGEYGPCWIFMMESTAKAQIQAVKEDPEPYQNYGRPEVMEIMEMTLESKVMPPDASEPEGAIG